MTEVAKARIAGRIDGLMTAYALISNAGKRQALMTLSNEINELRAAIDLQKPEHK